MVCVGLHLPRQGEVQIYQDELDRFLDAAQKLKVEGLLSTGDPEPSDSKEVSQFKNPKQERTNIPTELSEVQVYKEDPVRNGEHEKTVTINDMSEADDKIQQLTEKRDGRHFCTVCDYSSLNRTHLKEHVELHIEGLYYPCQLCQKVSQTKSCLRAHGKCLPQMMDNIDYTLYII